MKIDGMIKILEKHNEISMVEELKRIKDLLKTSRDVMTHGRTESVKNKLVDDINECLSTSRVAQIIMKHGRQCNEDQFK